MTIRRLFIVDAMAMAFRSYYAFGMGRPLTTSKGEPIAAVFGSAILLSKLISDQRPDYLAFASDAQEPTFRHAMFPAYKANRSAMPDDLAAQLPHFFRLLAGFGSPVLKTPGFEADDLIGTLAQRFAGDELHVYIVSGDKDFMQLVSDRVFIYTPKKGDEAVLIDAAGVQAKFGVTPTQVIDCLAIIGDTSDNVPGVHGIGDKGAAKLLGDFGSLDGIYANLAQITNKRQQTALTLGREQAYLSRTLVTIKTDCDVPFTLEDFRCDPAAAVANTALLALYRELEFRNLATKVENALGLNSRTETAVKTPAPSGQLQFQFGGEPQTSGKGAATSATKAAGESTIAEGKPLARAPNHCPGYRLVTTKAELAEVTQALGVATQFAFDTETTGLDIINDQPIGISLAVQSNAAWYIPLVANHLQAAATPAAAGEAPAETPLAVDEIILALRPHLTASRSTKIGHNLKFDVQMLANIGITVSGPLVDTMICDWLLDADGRQHGLDACCVRWLQYEKIKTTTLLGEHAEKSMLDANLSELTRYACEDADLTLRLYECLMPKIVAAELDKVLQDIEMPLVPVLARMERRGIYVDLPELAGLSARLSLLAQKLETDIHQHAGENFNINSPKQLSDILFQKLKIHEALGVRKLKKTKTGFSTDESVLQRLKAHPLAKALLEYRTAVKLKGTYADALPALAHKATGRIHTSFHQTGTATGRLSSAAPNLQNIPVRSPLGQEIRRAFKPHEGAESGAGLRGLAEPWVLISADYSQIELRVLAHLAAEDNLLLAFAEGVDIHRATAARVFGVAPAEVDAAMRSRAKAINFGIIYGMGARRLAESTGTTVAEATAFIDRYFASYPGIGKFIDATIAEAKATGVTRTISGRRRTVPGFGVAPVGESPSAIPASNFDHRSAQLAENIAVNTRIQGSAADLIKIAMIAVEKRLTHDPGQKLRARLLLQVHDELVLECPASEVEKTTTLIKECMMQAMTLDVPLEVTVGIGANWLEAH